MSAVYSATKLTEFAEAISRAAGFGPKDATTLSTCLIDAELRGVGSHGLVHLPMHIEELDRGLLKANPAVKTVKDSGPVVVLDGDSGLGQTLTIHATDLAIERARQFGICTVAMRNSGSFGVAGYYPERVAAQNMIGFALQNTAPHLAPHGAIDKLIGNNPFGIALPTGDVPIVLDIACSSVARASLHMAAKNNEKIPQEWAIDRNGEPTDDPKEALLGALVPFGGHKGYGLALVLGLLSGPLLGLDDRTFTQTMYFPRPKGYGVVIIVFNIAHFVEFPVYLSGVQDWISRLRSARLAANAEPLRYPGERSHGLKERRKREGIALPDAVVGDMQKLAQRFTHPFPNPLGAQ